MSHALQIWEAYMKTLKVIVPTSKIMLTPKMRKIAINRQFRIFSAIIELVRELVICHMPYKFGKHT